MNFGLLSPKEMKDYTLQQFYSLENNLSGKNYSLDEIGSILPGIRDGPGPETGKPQ